MRVLKKTPRSGEISFQNDGDHSVEPAHLLSGQIVLWMRFQSGIMDRFDLTLILEPARNLQRVRAMPFQAERQRFQAAQNKKTIERAGHGAHRILQKRNLISEFFV